MQLLLLAGELILLYVLSRRLTQAVYDITYLLFRARSVAIMVVTLLSFPGTVIHELSHLFTAEILGVHTGKLTLVPENIAEEEIKAGSVMIAQSDPFRRYAIGLAPIFTGLIGITALSYFLPSLWNNVTQSGIPILSNPNSYLLLLIAYLLFAVSNSMFSSPEDLKGFVPFGITVAIMIAAAYIAGIRIGLQGVALEFATKILDALVKSLGVVLAFNIIGLLTMKVLIVLTEKTTKRRIIKR